jgi:hypothetical protein
MSSIFRCASNILECNEMYLWYISMFFKCTHSVFIVNFNVFINIVIDISPSHSCYTTAFLPCAPTHTMVFHYPQRLPSQHALPLFFFFMFPLICSNFHIVYENIIYQLLFFTSTLSHTLYSTLSLVAWSIIKLNIVFAKFHLKKKVLSIIALMTLKYYFDSKILF